jgi:hypothetical protein
MTDLTRKCHEPESAVAADIRASLKSAEAQGLHGSLVEVAENLDTLATYAEGQRERPNCEALLAALVASAKERRGPVHPSRR